MKSVKPSNGGFCWSTLWVLEHFGYWSFLGALMIHHFKNFLFNVQCKKFIYYNNTSYVLGKDGNLLPAGSGMRRPKAQPEVCQFDFSRAINSNLFLKHMKYYFYFMFFLAIYLFKMLFLFMQKIFDRNGYPFA